MTAAGPERMMAGLTASMKERTGRTLEEWVALVEAMGPDPLDQRAVRRWLRDEHGVPQNSQWAIADAAARAAGWVAPTVEEYIEGQYQGAKKHLRPIFERLREEIEALGEDIRAEGRATYTPFVRRRQFAAVQGATRTRVDVGLRYTEPPASELLRPADSPGQATHRLSLTSVDQVDDEVRALLRAAYEQNG
jgi:predicted transport protein